MPRKPTTRPAPAKTGSLKARLRRAREQRHFDQAAALAKQVLLQTPSGPDADEARQAYLEVVGQLIPIDAKRARTFLNEAEHLPSAEGPWLGNVATLWARLGDGDRARQLLIRVADPSVPARITALLADHAVMRAASEPVTPSNEWQPGLGLVLQAFDSYARGDDEAARNALQQVGLASPFLEWKLLIRGLMAYSANEDSRAIDNWSRLDAERVPAKLILPLRAKIDPAFRGHLLPGEVKAVERRLTSFTDPLVAQLREVQRLMGTPETLDQALRRVEPLVEPLRRQRPELLPRLANCFYWLIVHGGQPEDLKRYERLFGAPADDREFHRMTALVMESSGDLAKANLAWRKYEREIAGDPNHWPGEAGKRARAMIWARMGDNATNYLANESDEDELSEFFDMFINSRNRSRPAKSPLKPDAEECYRQAVALSPDWQPAVMKLIDTLGEADRPADAEEVARQFLEKRPDAGEVWVDLADLQMATGKLDEAAATLKRVIEANPLDRQHRAMLVSVNIDRARKLILHRDYAGARTTLADGATAFDSVLGDLARVLDFVAAEKEGADAPADWVATNVGRPVVAYMLLVESQRLKLPKKTVGEREAAFNEILGRPMPPKDLRELASVLGMYRREKPTYRGVTAHEKKILAGIQGWLATDPPPPDLLQFGSHMLRNEFAKPLLDLVKHARRRFPADPAFMYLQGEQVILQKPKSFSPRTVGRLFREVLRLIEGRHDEVCVRMREAIEQRRQQYPALDDEMSPRFNFFNW